MYSQAPLLSMTNSEPSEQEQPNEAKDFSAELAPSSTPENEFDRLEREALALESGNRALEEQLLDGYIRLLRTIDRSDPHYSRAVERTRELRARLRENAPVQETARPDFKTDPFFETLQHDLLFPESDRQRAIKSFGALPEKLQETYLKRLKDIYTKPSEATRITSLRAVTFEMSRITLVVEQGRESIDLSEAMDDVVVDYVGFASGETTFDAAHQHKEKSSAIDFDVPISRDGLPYSYEVKSYSRKRYGDNETSRNQLLKYQTAIEQGKISGATVEVRGRVSVEFLKWAMGTAVIDRGYVPDVEIVYTLELPSGKEYRFVLKRKESGQGLQFHNEERVTVKFLALLRHRFQATRPVF